MEEEKDKKWWMDHHAESLKHWRSWGSWYSWGSATGLSIFLLSIGGFIYILHAAGLIGR
jgi:hypothetical protein